MARKTMSVMAVGAAALFGGVAWATGAIASIVGDDGVVTACYSAGGQLRVVSDAGSCRANESPLRLLSDTAKAADSDKLDGRDSSDFYAAGSKVADADSIDGLDSSAFALSGQACPAGKVATEVNADGTLRCDGQLQGPKGDTGATGPAGADGVSGWEIEHSPEITVPPGRTSAWGASCATDKKVLGGGVFTTGGEIQTTAPTAGGEAWAGRVSNSTPFSVTMRIYAICADVS